VKLTKFRVTYRRPKPAGAIKFDPSQEFIDLMDISASTPEEAMLSLAGTMPFLQVSKIEKTSDAPLARYGEARYDQSTYASNVVASGAKTVWPDKPDLPNNLSAITGSIASFVSNYTSAQATIETLRTIGVDQRILNPLQGNIEMMRKEADDLRLELTVAVGEFNQKKLQELAADSPANAERGTLASRIVEELVACNLLSKKRLSFEFFNCSPEVINTLHTPCVDGDDFKIKIGALANIFETNIKALKELVHNVQDDWKSIKLLEEWAKQNSLPYDPVMLEVWRNIVEMRNATFPFHKTDPRLIVIMTYFGQAFPPKYPELWNEILTRFAESITKFRILLSGPS
jgi:hypothetical protein